jgi:hypothetical protein
MQAFVGLPRNVCLESYVRNTRQKSWQVFAAVPPDTQARTQADTAYTFGIGRVRR